MLGKTAELHARTTAERASPCENNIAKQARHNPSLYFLFKCSPNQTAWLAVGLFLQENCCVTEFQTVGGNEAAETNATCHPQIQLHASSVGPKVWLRCSPANSLPSFASEPLLESKCTLWLLDIWRFWSMSQEACPPATTWIWNAMLTPHSGAMQVN